MPANYRVGRGKTPKATRYKPGQSGNPKGRPRFLGTRDENIFAVLEKPVRFLKNGRFVTLTPFEIAVRRLVVDALKGDVGAAIEFVQLCEKYDVISKPW
jgi:hypothetical protein